MSLPLESVPPAQTLAVSAVLHLGRDLCPVPLPMLFDHPDEMKILLTVPTAPQRLAQHIMVPATPIVTSLSDHRIEGHCSTAFSNALLHDDEVVLCCTTCSHRQAT